MRYPFLAGSFAMALASAAPCAAQMCPPNFDSGHTVEYYEVSGETFEDLEKSLNRGAPSGPGGAVVYGLTEWCVRWDFVPWRKRDGCELVHISTVLRTKVVLPVWADSETAPAPLREWWEVFSRVLEEHENVHVESGRSAEAAIARAIASNKDGASCAMTASKANRVAQDLYFDHLARDRAFDRETRHGLDQLEAALTPR